MTKKDKIIQIINNRDHDEMENHIYGLSEDGNLYWLHEETPDDLGTRWDFVGESPDSPDIID